MLYKNTVAEERWHLLEELMSHYFLSSFYLVGGTALSLQFGHRLTDDIGLFSNEDFDPAVLQKQLEHYYAGAEIDFLRPMPFGIFSSIRDTKVDFMYWGEPFINPAVDRDGIRMGSLEDILAMKLEAVTNRKTRKNFYDLAVLFQTFTLQQGIEFYKRRYPYYDEMAVLKTSLTFSWPKKSPIPCC